MVSKKGAVITGSILAAITIASFLVWLTPQNNEQTFVVSDFETHLNDVKEIHGVLVDGIESEFQKMLDEDISPTEYIDAAQVSSSQIQSQIIQLVESKAPQEWEESYMNYIESLRSTNSQIRETIVVAEMIKNGADKNKIDEELAKIDELREKSQSYATASDNSRP